MKISIVGTFVAIAGAAMGISTHANAQGNGVYELRPYSVNDYVQSSTYVNTGNKRQSILEQGAP